MARTIPYKNKKQTSGTIHRQLTKQDLSWTLDHMRELISLDDAFKAAGTPTLISASLKLNAPNKNMPSRTMAHGGGKNSARSMCEGVLDNFENSGQYDLSHLQMPGVEEAFRVAHSVCSDFEEVIFEEDDLPSNKVFAKEEIRGPGMFSEIFDLSQYEFVTRTTVEKKVK